jgi:phospholipase C
MATSTSPAATSMRVVVFIQENKTTDFYFPSLAAWGADVLSGGPLLSTPPNHDQPHGRSAWVHFRLGDYPGLAVQIDNDAIIPYYSWLAKTFTFCDHHVGLGTNSTPGHMMVIGGQTPTLKNPPFGADGPQWELPSIFMHAQRAGLT